MQGDSQHLGSPPPSLLSPHLTRRLLPLSLSFSLLSLHIPFAPHFYPINLLFFLDSTLKLAAFPKVEKPSYQQLLTNLSLITPFCIFLPLIYRKVQIFNLFIFTYSPLTFFFPSKDTNHGEWIPLLV